MKTLRILIAGAVSSLLFVSTAWPHAHLDRASPAERAEETTSPAAVTLTFTQEIELTLSSIKVTNGKGEPIPTGAPENVGGNRKSLRVGLPRLAPGVYKVDWAVTSVDTHRVDGSYTFAIKP
ncbi:copper resistance protein CopC [Rhizobium puerariae]|uniref:Copper resistance protein CopC n=1 Tax=Rhizobium puerariae TaxID=1585791 RepID=A0ABV6AAF2_9HYPH